MRYMRVVRIPWRVLLPRHGSKFVRVVFIVIVITLIVKTGADAWSLYPRSQ